MVHSEPEHDSTGLHNLRRAEDTWLAVPKKFQALANDIDFRIQYRWRFLSDKHAGEHLTRQHKANVWVEGTCRYWDKLLLASSPLECQMMLQAILAREELISAQHAVPRKYMYNGPISDSWVLCDKERPPIMIADFWTEASTLELLNGQSPNDLFEYARPYPNDTVSIGDKVSEYRAMFDKARKEKEKQEACDPSAQKSVMAEWREQQEKIIEDEMRQLAHDKQEARSIHNDWMKGEWRTQLSYEVPKEKKKGWFSWFFW
jgi:hypothetical protein